MPRPDGSVIETDAMFFCVSGVGGDEAERAWVLTLTARETGDPSSAFAINSLRGFGSSPAVA